MDRLERGEVPAGGNYGVLDLAAEEMTILRRIFDYEKGELETNGDKIDGTFPRLLTHNSASHFFLRFVFLEVDSNFGRETTLLPPAQGGRTTALVAMLSIKEKSTSSRGPGNSQADAVDFRQTRRTAVTEIVFIEFLSRLLDVLGVGQICHHRSDVHDANLTRCQQRRLNRSASRFRQRTLRSHPLKGPVGVKSPL